MSSTAVSSKNEDSPLLKLAAELRNEIYQLVCTTNSHSKINTFYTKEPDARGLLLSCREVQNEAIAIYKHARETYWSKNHFYLDKIAVEAKEAAWGPIDRYLPDRQHLQSINHFVIEDGSKQTDTPRRYMDAFV